MDQIDVGQVALVLEGVVVDSLVFEVQQAQHQGAECGFGMLPTDGLERSPGAGDEDCFVADVTVVARAVAPEAFDHFMGPAVAHQCHNRPVGALFVPILHSRVELGGGPTGRRQRSVHRAQLKVPLLHVLLL